MFDENNSSLKRKNKTGKLTILQNKIEVIHNGAVLNNNELLNQIKVPEKI